MRDRALLNDGIRRAACVIAVLVGAAYITWRLAFTLNPDALWFAIPLWVAELYGMVSSALYFYTVWDTRGRIRPAPAREGRRVDVYIPTYNEPLWMIRRTALAALAIRYPHSTWILDDGARAGVERLARRLGCGYIARPGNEGAKAGNLNWAMGRTSGDFVAVFDTDHVPLPEFLDRTLGYFDDERIAFVQSPQEYYNVESFQHQTDVRRHRSWHEQSLFYRVIQPGKDRWNAAFFCGSCGVMRRAALDEIGGFATETITEDMHTSMRLHARGWSSAYHNEVLALGLAAQTATPYHLQRLRWGQGTMQVLRREGLLGARGLTVHQRINYLASALHYFDGFQRLVLYTAPPLCVATGVLPIRSLSLTFVAALVAYYGTSFAAFKLASRGYGMFIATERFHMVRFFTYIRTCVGLLTRRRLGFKVSPKAAAGGADRRAAFPIVTVAAYIAVCIAAGFVRLALGGDHNAIAFWTNLAWTGWSILLVATALRMTMRSSDHRAVPRARAGLPVWWWSGGARGVGVLVDVSEQGAAVLVERGCVAGPEVTVDVRWPAIALRREGTVRHARRDDQGVLLALRWSEVGEEEAVGLSRLSAELTARHYLLTYDHPWDRLGMLQLRRGHRRRSARRSAFIPVLIGPRDRGRWGVTEDVSDAGALVLSPDPAPIGESIELRPWDGGAVRAEVMRCEELERPPGRAWRLGLRLEGAIQPEAARRPEPLRAPGTAA